MSGSKDLRGKVKSLWISGMKAIGNTAANIASNTKYKVDEVTIQNRRREILNDLAHKAYALWLKGEPFPEQMEKLLNELNQLDEQLNDLRAEKYAVAGSSVQTTDSDRENTPTDEAEQPEAEEELSVTVNNYPVSAEINELFDSAPSVGRSAEKVNSAMDQLSDRIRNFSREIDETEKE